jgi:hypothetical protein
VVVSAVCAWLFPFVSTFSELQHSLQRICVSVCANFAVADPSRVIRIKASMDIGHSVVGEQGETTGSVEKVKGFDRFKGGFFQEFGAAVTRYGKKLEDGRGRGRNGEATHSHNPWEYLYLPSTIQVRVSMQLG